MWWLFILCFLQNGLIAPNSSTSSVDAGSADIHVEPASFRSDGDVSVIMLFAHVMYCHYEENTVLFSGPLLSWQI